MRLGPIPLSLLLGVLLAGCRSAPPQVREPRVEVRLDPGLGQAHFDGRVLVFLSRLEPEPRTLNNPARLEPVLGLDVRGLAAGESVVLGGPETLAWPTRLADLEGGRWWVQAVLDLDPDAPFPGTASGNPCSAAVQVELGRGLAPRVELVCDRRVPASYPEETRWVKRVEVHSELLSRFHGQEVALRALVHLPRGWYDEPEREWPLFLFVSGFGATFEGFRSVDWPAPPLSGEDYVVVYPDPSCPYGHSAFLDSDVNGPWGSAFVEELLPALEGRFRAIADREARFLAGHSSGAWAALALMLHHPERFGAVWASSPDPVDFRDFMGVDLYAEGANLLVDADGRPRPFCRLGSWDVNYTVEHAAREAVLRGGVLAFFEALLGAREPDGAPQRLFERATGAVDPAAVAAWSRNDLCLLLRTRWDEMGPWLDGRLLLTVGDKDNFLLAGSMELLRRELEALGADVDVRTLSGDHFSRLGGPHAEDPTARIVARFRAWNALRLERQH